MIQCFQFIVNMMVEVLKVMDSVDIFPGVSFLNFMLVITVLFTFLSFLFHQEKAIISSDYQSYRKKERDAKMNGKHVKRGKHEKKR